ncbi:serine hydrolase domain-containing protein [Microlunatus ginsengisoli]|uniref:Beta-lactamase-related domain-containing protein n=1 Tax=Microlunatus ginsengisoli TaxID=363863 RepID=A0ABP7ASH7_9ACTN
MRPSRRWAAAAAVVLAALVGSANPASADPTVSPPDATTIARIETYLADQVAERGVPGMEYALVRGDTVIALNAIGVADGAGRKLTPQTPMLLASLSKNLTATAVMQLVEAGKIRLDAAVTTYLPWFRTADPAVSATITVAQLLHHTSGMPTTSPSQNGLLGDDSPAALERGVRALDGVELLTTPGTAFHYSNLNYNILGLIVQTVSGESFADYLSRHVFEPAEMGGASAGPHPGPGAAAGFYPWFGRFRPTSVPEPASLMPSAISYASAADLARVLIMNLNEGEVGGSRILEPASVAELHRPAFAADDFQAYAMGWYVRPGWEFDDPTSLTTSTRLPLLLEHGGSWSTTRTYLGFLPGEKIGVAILINANQPATESELQAIPTSVWRIIAGRQPTESSASEPLLQQYGWQVAAAIVAVLLASAAWSLWLLRRPAVHPRARLAVFAAMLALDVGVLAVIWRYLPVAFDTTTVALMRANPDVGILLAVATLIAAGWGLARTVLATLPFFSRRGGSGRGTTVPRSAQAHPGR